MSRTHRSLPVRLLLLSVLVVAVAPGSARAAEYVVGSGSYPTLASVPWSSLGPGDIVTIPHRAEPYRETFAVTTSGTAQAPILVRGTRGPGDARPVIDGENAVQGANTHVRALLSLRNGASNVIVEGLEFRNAHIDYAHDGLFPGHNASGIYVEDASHVVIRDCELHGNGNGLFSAPGTVDLRVERNYLWGNGNVGRAFEHNSYTETDGIVFEGNRYGPLCSGCPGNNLKDRSAGTVIRYNFIEGGNRALDLVHAESDDADFTQRVATTPTYVYGNVFIKTDDTTQSQVVHFGGDDGSVPNNYRRALRFYNNTVYSTRAVRTTFFHCDAPAPDVDIRNSVFVTPSSSQIYLLDSSSSTGATVALVNSYLPPTWDVSVEVALDAAVTTTGVTTGTTPGFVNGPAFDFHLLPSAAVRDGGAALLGGVPALLREYVTHQDTRARDEDGPLDLGAFEVCESGCAPVVPPDGGVIPGGDSAVPPLADGGRGADGGTEPGAGGGCGCRVQRAPHTRPGALALLFLLTLIPVARAARRRPRT
ncbi:MAG: right-handed parallel beta-helix repeat-containing protein [Myxococcales bacterium]|nr:right-handed parallel beta-helix repeat-containing protein [Myxococcales bacterium]